MERRKIIGLVLIIGGAVMLPIGLGLFGIPCIIAGIVLAVIEPVSDPELVKKRARNIGIGGLVLLIIGTITLIVALQIPPYIGWGFPFFLDQFSVQF
ncbi:MAG: hypothetical protein ACW986_08860 [Promethearchaeota archaeon]|jgi:hypothetical protein